MIVVVGNQKGGVGKSTLVVNLAVAWQQAGKSVIVVETDPSVFTTSVWSDDRVESGLPPIPVVKKSGAVKSVLLNFGEQYDIVLVDLPGKDSPEMRSAMLAADLFLIPTQPNQVDIDATIGLVPVIEVALEYNETLKTAVVINRLTNHVKSTDHADAVELLSEYFPVIMPTALHERKAYQVSIIQGKSVLEMSDQKAAAEILGLLNDIEKEMSDD